jgi:recombinational DNA repair protein RecT
MSEKTEQQAETAVVEAPKEIAKRQSPAQKFRMQVYQTAGSLLSSWVGDDKAREAAGRLSVALAASASSARKPDDFFDCTPESVARVVATSALTGIMPSTGAASLAYAIPRRPRKGEQPQLQYMLSHRGINALANRAGLHMLAIPISYSDEIEVAESGEVKVKSIDIDNPPMREDELRGVVVQVKRLETGLIVATGWVAKKLILERRQGSDGYRFAEQNEYAKDSDPWHKWFVEMAMKTAMHYAISRGWCVIDDTEAVRALSADVADDVIDAESTPVKRVGGIVEAIRKEFE